MKVTLTDDRTPVAHATQRQLAPRRFGPVVLVEHAPQRARHRPELSIAQATAVAAQCRALAMKVPTSLRPPGKAGADDCASNRIFITGANAQEAADHDIDAMTQQPQWFYLNWEGSTPKRDWTPRRWYLGHPDCEPANAPTGSTPPYDCDEYPFFATEQGGERAQPVPDLRPVNADQDRHQGRMLYLTLAQPCMRPGQPPADPEHNSTGGSSFLSVPLPRLSTEFQVPTMGLCNGNTTADP